MQEFVATGKYGIANIVMPSKPQEKNPQAAPVDDRDAIMILDAFVIFCVLAQKLPK
jgi:hypothetical protein